MQQRRGEPSADLPDKEKVCAGLQSDWTGPCARYHTRPRGCSHDRLIRHLEPSSDRSAGCGEICGPRGGERREGSTAVREGGGSVGRMPTILTLKMQAHRYANIAQRDHVDRALFPTSSLATRGSRDGIVEAVTGCYTFWIPECRVTRARQDRAEMCERVRPENERRRIGRQRGSRQGQCRAHRPRRRLALLGLGF